MNRVLTCIERALYLAADTARRIDPDLAGVYRRLVVEKGHYHKQAPCASRHTAGQPHPSSVEDRYAVRAPRHRWKTRPMSRQPKP